MSVALDFIRDRGANSIETLILDKLDKRWNEAEVADCFLKHCTKLKALRISGNVKIWTERFGGKAQSLIVYTRQNRDLNQGVFSWRNEASF